MIVDGSPYRTIWEQPDNGMVCIIDQTRLPHRFEVIQLSTLDDVVTAIRDMQVRGAPLIGATAAYGVAIAMAEECSAAALVRARTQLLASRPTAVNLRWAVERMEAALKHHPQELWQTMALEEARSIADQDVATNSAIGDAGLEIIRNIAETKPGCTVNLLTHCNAGWLATVDWGTALAPIYKAQDAGIPVHVWVDETRPRNQGASLTTWELSQHGVPNTLIADNAGGHLMQQGQVDLCIVGSDRTTLNGDVCNKIGTYLKALAAWDNQVPFHVALPRSTVDQQMHSGADIPIEERGEEEVTHISGLSHEGPVSTVALAPKGVRAANPAFDVTPARLITGYICETGASANLGELL